LSTTSPDHHGVSNRSQENNQYSNDISASADEDCSSLDEVFSFVIGHARVHFARAQGRMTIMKIGDRQNFYQK
jgi:hypothetical protein